MRHVGLGVAEEDLSRLKAKLAPDVRGVVVPKPVRVPVVRPSLLLQLCHRAPKTGQ